jgi:hypothetical protein
MHTIEKNDTFFSIGEVVTFMAIGASSSWFLDNDMFQYMGSNFIYSMVGIDVEGFFVMLDDVVLVMLGLR